MDVLVGGRFGCRDVRTQREAAYAGFGIGARPAGEVERAQRAREIERVLPRWTLEPIPVYVLQPPFDRAPNACVPSRPSSSYSSGRSRVWQSSSTCHAHGLVRLTDKSLLLAGLAGLMPDHNNAGMNAQATAPLELFTFGSTNGHKAAIALEELGFAYRVHTVNVFAGEGRALDFLAMNPAGKIPVLRDREADLVLTESDAILLYLADKAGRLVPAAGKDRTRAIELLFLQASLQGPMFGQRMHFSLFSGETVPYAIRRYEEQCALIDDLVEQLLSGRRYFLGSEYSIVDIAFFSWYFASRAAGFETGQHANLNAWYERVRARPAVARGVMIPAPLPELPPRKVA